MSERQIRRVVAPLPIDLYAKLCAIKLRTGRTLESLLLEAVSQFTTQDRIRREGEKGDGVSIQQAE